MSITVDAVSYDDYIYTTAITYDTGETEVYVSTDYPTVWADTKSSTDISDVEGIYIFDLDGNKTFVDPVIQLVYNEALNSWVCYEVIQPSDGTRTLYRFGATTARSDGYQRVWLTFTRPTQVVTNYTGFNSAEKAYVQNYSNDMEQLPHGLTESTIRDILDEQLNSQTDAGSTATTIINNTTIQYNSYQAGDITGAEMQSYVAANLEELSGLEAGTLLDAMQINNALTYNQAIQDELLNNASSTVQAMFDKYVRYGSSYYYFQYKNGSVTQEEANRVIINLMRDLSNELASGAITTTADLEAANVIMQMMQTSLDAIHNEKDISVDVSDKSQASDAEELALLDEMVTAMQAEEIENPMKDQQTMSDAVTVRDSIADIWVNKYMLALTAMFGMLVIPCIILRTHYRMM